MSSLVVSFMLFLPVLLPLLLAGLVLVLRGNHTSGVVVLAGLAIATIPILPIPGIPRETPPLPWFFIGGAAVPIQLSAGSFLRAGMSLLLLSAASLGLWSAMRIHMLPSTQQGAVGAGSVSARVALTGALLAVCGGQLAVLSVTSLPAVFGLGIVLLGTFVSDVAAAPPGDQTALRGAVPLLAAILLLAMAALPGMATAYTAAVWSAGCSLLIVVSALRAATSRAQLCLYLPAQAVGLAPLATWLLVSPPGGMPAYGNASSSIALAGLVLCLLGAANVTAGITLREVLAAQWAAQLGLVLLLAGRSAAGEPRSSTAALAALANAVLSTVALGLAVGRLVIATGTDRIAELPALPSPLRRAGLAYGVAAASAAGLPLTLGYTLRQIASAGSGSAAVLPLLLAGSSLLLAGLAPPAAAFFRRPVLQAATGENLDGRVGAALLFGLLLIVLAPYHELAAAGTRMFGGPGNPSPGRAEGASTPALLGAALLQIVAALVFLAYANRSLKRGPAGPAFNGGLPLDEEPGWPLPFAGLRQILAPLSARTWIAVSESLARNLGSLPTSILPTIQRIERRYYLGVLVLATILIVLFATGGVQP